jgi:mannitol/fructose-specific phosphotransferase system IIA component
LLQHLLAQGGSLALNDMHEYSLKKFLIQHQAFSRLMENLVEDGLVEFDYVSYLAKISESGKKYISQDPPKNS